ncbi:hypothetical protein BDV39DRAFT_206901 [Aspergillus sergii]|uniref:Metallo-beta-lactamase domain-containing protein n=1 Tax=Aspergillus sergii TaxID=1034303 RepID=A0A5N6WX95_9EURO|nr:hypothetical protein BDV39DRAFT_206901 [Aspergillus sergii]
MDGGHFEKNSTTLEWFGATTFRLKAKGLTIFLDTWLDKPSCLYSALAVDDIVEADYIFISHAHFDHLPGADRLALKTGAVVVGNYEAINILRKAGVPDEQLQPVSGGERIPLFTRDIRDRAARGEGKLLSGPPGAPHEPDPSLAVCSVQVWPSLHCLMPGSHADIPEVMDTGRVFTGAAHPYLCTINLNIGMRYGLLKVGERVPPESRDDRLQSFIEYVTDNHRNVFSAYDGGQLMYNFLIDEKKTLLWNAHLGAYEGIMRGLDPKPNVAILGIAGRANINGRPFDGSAAQFALNEVRWLDEPRSIIWCLHDESPIKPYRIDTEAATAMVEENSASRLTHLAYGRPFHLFSP